jgi:hypothetical protein
VPLPATRVARAAKRERTEMKGFILWARDEGYRDWGGTEVVGSPRNGIPIFSMQ